MGDRRVLQLLLSVRGAMRKTRKMTKTTAKMMKVQMSQQRRSGRRQPTSGQFQIATSTLCVYCSKPSKPGQEGEETKGHAKARGNQAPTGSCRDRFCGLPHFHGCGRSRSSGPAESAGTVDAEGRTVKMQRRPPTHEGFWVS